MFSTGDTIVAVATPSGRGGLGVVRLSGPEAHAIACALVARDAFEARRATFSRLDTGAGVIDQVVITYFPHPRSYTAEDVVEIAAHGSPVVLRQIVEATLARGARLARPGEFTFRAFLHGRIDLTQAEAVADLIDAMTPLQARAASEQLEGSLGVRLQEVDAAILDLIARLEASLDFPDEGYHFIEPQAIVDVLGRLRSDVDALLSRPHEGRLVREGARVVLLGRPNAGKSTIFNRLCRSERAIVAPAPGTTRDVIVEAVDLNGVPVTLVDTAGVRESADWVEQEGVRRASEAARVADLVLVVLDLSEPLGAGDAELLEMALAAPRLLVANKRDRPCAWDPGTLRTQGAPVCEVSAISGDGFLGLIAAIEAALGATSEMADPPLVTNQRHAVLLRACCSALDRAVAAAARLGERAPEEVLLVDLNDARGALDEVMGRRTSDDVLARIFERFCIGK